MPPREKPTKNCSKCKKCHTYPWGNSCRNFIQQTETMAGVNLPDEDSAEFLPALKSEYAKLVDEKNTALSITDQFKAMEARMQDRLEKQISAMENSFKDLMSKTPGQALPPAPTGTAAGAQTQQIQAGVPQPPSVGVPIQPAQSNQGATGQNPAQQNTASTSGNVQSPLINPIATHSAPSSLDPTIAALSMSIDKHLSEEKRGNKYRPEFYVQCIDNNVPVKNMDFNKLSHRDLIHGMSRVVQNMVRESDPRLSSYIDHMVFMTSLAAEGGFINEPFLKYDHHVVDKAMRTGSGFDIDPMASS